MSEKKHFSKIVVVGMGLLGGSLVKAIKEKKIADYVIAVSRKQESLDRALLEGTIDQGEQLFGDYLKEADLVILCTPVKNILEEIVQLSSLVGDHTVVTDIGSTKNDIVTAGEEYLKNFIGSHPMAGSEKSGYEFSKSDMFQDKTCVLAVTSQSNKKSVTTLDDFWVSLGARVCYVSPDEHDRIVGMSSHLPHFIAASLVQSMDHESMNHVSQGFWDTTRIASGSVDMWVDICKTNQPHILAAIKTFTSSLDELKDLLENQKYQEISTWLNEAKNKRDLSL